MNTQLAKRNRKDRFLPEDLEKIEVSKIKVVKASGNLCAVVGEWRHADKILAEWFDPAQDRFECQFRVEFLDGLVVRGHYSLKRASRQRPSLYKFLNERLKHIKLDQQVTDEHFHSPDCQRELDFFSKYSLGNL